MSDTLVVNEIYLSLQGESTFAGLPCIFVRLAACDLRCSYCDTAYAFTEGSKRSIPDIRAEVHRLAEPFDRVEDAEFGVQTPHPGGHRLRHPLSWKLGEPAGNPSPALQGTLSPFEGERERERGPASIPRPAPIQVGDSGVWRLPLVELTGGEPLLQKNSLPLMKSLCDDGFTVLLETSGAHDIGPVDPRVRRIMDLKCPGSGEAARNRWENLPHLKSTDEIKFVITTREDYAWARQRLSEYKLASLCPLLFSWAHPLAPEQRDKSLKPVPLGHTSISRRELAEKIIADALPVRFQVQLHKVIWPPEERGV